MASTTNATRVSPNRDNLFVLPAAEIANRGIKTLPPTLLHAADNLDTNDVLAADSARPPMARTVVILLR